MRVCTANSLKRCSIIWEKNLIRNAEVKYVNGALGGMVRRWQSSLDEKEREDMMSSAAGSTHPSPATMIGVVVVVAASAAARSPRDEA